MTVDPKLRLTPGEYLIHPDGSASKVVDKRNMTVDEILATGRYTDRRGRVWTRMTPRTSWACAWNRQIINSGQMSLLVERDQHTGKCAGLPDCISHPVPIVVVGADGVRFLDEFVVRFNGSATVFSTLPEALDAARALAVGE